MSPRGLHGIRSQPRLLRDRIPGSVDPLRVLRHDGRGGSLLAVQVLQLQGLLRCPARLPSFELSMTVSGLYGFRIDGFPPHFRPLQPSQVLRSFGALGACRSPLTMHAPELLSLLGSPSGQNAHRPVHVLARLYGVRANLTALGFQAVHAADAFGALVPCRPGGTLPILHPAHLLGLLGGLRGHALAQAAFAKTNDQQGAFRFWYVLVTREPAWARLDIGLAEYHFDRILRGPVLVGCRQSIMHLETGPERKSGMSGQLAQLHPGRCARSQAKL